MFPFFYTQLANDFVLLTVFVHLYEVIFSKEYISIFYKYLHDSVNASFLDSGKVGCKEYIYTFNVHKVKLNEPYEY